MSRFTLALLSLAIVFAACDDDSNDNGNTNAHWDAEFLIANAGAPALAPDGLSILFTREGEQGGLFLWQDSIETRVTEAGTSVRSDYVWSLSVPLVYAFTIPGIANEAAGVYVGLPGTIDRHQVWDRGQDPAFEMAGDYLLVAGAPDDAAEAGVWRINISDGSRARLTEIGERPEMSPDLESLAYLIPHVQSSGGSLVIRHIATGTEITVGEHVVNFGWTDTDELVIEVIADSLGLQIPPVIFRVRVGNLEKDLIAQPAANLRVFGDGGYAYNRLNADVLGALILVTKQNSYEFPDSLTLADGFSSETFIASGPSGVTRIRRL